MPDFDTRRREEPNKPNSRPRSPAMAGRVLNPLIAILRLAPIASYALAQIIVVGLWAHMVSEEGVAPQPEYGPGLLHPFLVTAVWIVLMAIFIVPFGAFFGAVDAAARRSRRPLLQALLLGLDALLIVLFALVLIVPFGGALLYFQSCDGYTCVSNTPGWPEYIGVLVGAELGLVMLVVVSMRGRR